MLLGRKPGANLGAAVQQSNAVFARVRGGQASPAQLVEALRQLAAIAREADGGDLEVVTGREPFRQLVADLVQQLPRDSGERVAWEAAWTGQVAEALEALRAHEASPQVPQLCSRLGHALVQAAPEMELEELLHAVCGLCTVDGQGLAPDDYALWVLGSRLEELCRSKAPGELRMARLAPLLHLFAHPATRARVAARASPDVLRHVRHGLPECGVSEVAKLLQAYSDVPGIMADVLAVLAKAPQQLQHASLPELAAVAAALPGQEIDVGGILGAVASRLLALLRPPVAGAEGAAGGLGTAVEVELATAVLAALLEARPGSDATSRSELREAVGILGELVHSGGSSGSGAAEPAPALKPDALPADVLAQLLSLGVSLEPGGADQAPAWLPSAAGSLAPRAGELSAARLAALASALAASNVALDAAMLEAVQTAAIARAPSLSPEEFCTIALALGSAGSLQPGLLEAFDVEACLVRSPPPGVVAGIAWSLASAGSESEVAWALVDSDLGSRGAEWRAATASEKGMLYEALATRRAAVGRAWKSTGPAAEVLLDKSWQRCWHERRAASTPPSAYGDQVASLLEELDISFERDREGEDKTYVMPFLLPEKGVIVDLVAASARHPVSRQARGELVLRHGVWNTAGRSILAIPDSSWAGLAAKAPAAAAEGEAAGGSASAEAAAAATRKVQREWLEEKLASLVRQDLAREANLQDDTVDALRDVPFGEDGLNLEGLRRLAQEPEPVRRRSVQRFLETFRETRVRNLTGWMIGIIKKEKEAVEQEEKVAKRDAIAERPAEGWEHKTGRPLDQAKVGKFITGRVTNELHGRFWLDAGFTKDVTFQSTRGRFQIGDELVGLKIAAVDAEKGWIEAKATNDTRKKDEPRPGGRRAPRSGSPSRAADAKLPVGAKPAAREASWGAQRFRRASAKAPAGEAPEAGADGAGGRRSLSQGWKAAEVSRPASGWKHEGGRSLGELQVGEIVGGRVTNRLHERFWVDIGASHDASFWQESGDHKVGDVVEGMAVLSVNLEKNHVVLQPPPAAKQPSKEQALEQPAQ